MMGLEEHLIGMFRHDFEFVDGHRSHLGDGAPAAAPVAAPAAAPAADAGPGGAAAQVGTLQSGHTATATLVAERPAESLVAERPAESLLAEQLASTTTESIQAVGTAVAGAPVWTPDGEAELHKIPFFVRGKVRRNTEAFASERGLARIDAEALYDAKAHFSR
jgi:light-independent protochlorophyllide reductase subunit B